MYRNGSDTPLPPPMHPHAGPTPCVDANTKPLVRVLAALLGLATALTTLALANVAAVRFLAAVWVQLFLLITPLAGGQHTGRKGSALYGRTGFGPKPHRCMCGVA